MVILENPLIKAAWQWVRLIRIEDICPNRNMYFHKKFWNAQNYYKLYMCLSQSIAREWFIKVNAIIDNSCNFFLISKASNVRAFQLGKVKLVGLIVVLEVLKLFSPSRGMTSWLKEIHIVARTKIVQTLALQEKNDIVMWTNNFIVWEM